jgi:hypothetical protein
MRKFDGPALTNERCHRGHIHGRQRRILEDRPSRDPVTLDGVRNKRQLRLGKQGLIALGDMRLFGGLGGTKTAR